MIENERIRRELDDAQRLFLEAAREAGPEAREHYERALEKLLAASDQARMRA